MKNKNYPQNILESTKNYENDIWNKDYDKFNGEYCSRWISVYNLKKDESIAVPKDHNEDNNLINSSVVNTEIEDCSLKCLSLDQIGRFNFDASAKYTTSFESEILEENSLINLEYSDLSMNMTFSLRDLIAELKLIPDFSDNSSLYLYSSINAKSGANNLNENLENRELVTLECLDNANKMLASTTNFILDYNSFSFLNRSAIPLFTLRPISTLHSVNPLSSSCLSLFNISSFQANCLALDSMQVLTNPDQLISGKLFILSLTSSGTDKVIDTILPVEKHKNVKLFKSFDSDINLFFDKIVSIKQPSSQHVYNLAIEGTHNFIANDIATHSACVRGNLNLAGGTMTGNLNLSANVNLTMNGGNQIGSNVTCVTIKGPSSILEIC